MKPFLFVISLFSLLLLALPASAIERGDAAAGEEKAQACLACHSASAVEGNPEWPRLNGQHTDYIVQALRAYQSGTRQNAIMRAQVEDLSRQDMRDLGAWFSAQQGELNTPGQQR
ncbi:MAG: cytochrome c [Aquisalimonadaceae bacterium]